MYLSFYHIISLAFIRRTIIPFFTYKDSPTVTHHLNSHFGQPEMLFERLIEELRTNISLPWAISCPPHHCSPGPATTGVTTTATSSNEWMEINQKKRNERRERRSKWDSKDLRRKVRKVKVRISTSNTLSSSLSTLASHQSGCLYICQFCWFLKWMKFIIIFQDKKFCCVGVLPRLHPAPGIHGSTAEVTSTSQSSSLQPPGCMPVF